MEFKYMIRGLLTLVAIVISMITMSILIAISYFLGLDLALTDMIIVSLIVIIVLVFFITPWGKTVLGKDILANVDRQLDEQLTTLNDSEMLELSIALDEVSERFGIDIIAPTKRKKQKREHIDTAVRNLSDTELLHLKERLRNGQVDEDKLLAWLEEQRQINEDYQ